MKFTIYIQLHLSNVCIRQNSILGCELFFVNDLKIKTSTECKAIILMTNSSLMKVESIAECSPWNILQYF